MKLYNNDLIRIYFWNSLSTIFRLILTFVVIRMISENKNILGIYSVCISLSIFFSYSDLGFLKSAIKFSSEYVLSKEYDKQLRILGSGVFITFISIIIINIPIFVIAIKPVFLINHITEKEIVFARSLILIVGAYSIFEVFKKYVVSFLSINLKNYYSNIISFVISFLSLIYLFSTNNNEDYFWVIKYVFLVRVLEVIGIIVLFYLVKIKYGISFLTFFKSFTYNKKIITSSLKLSISGFIVSLLFLLFFEFDNIYLAKKVNLEKLSFYSVALISPLLLRTFFGIIYSPFSSIVNYSIHSKHKTMSSIRNLIWIFFDVVVLAVIIPFVFSKAIIFSYLGNSYAESVIPLSILSLLFLFTFLTYPLDIYIFSKKKYRLMYFLSFCPVITFWGINFIQIEYIGIVDLNYFVLAKLIGMYINVPIYFLLCFKEKIFSFFVVKKLLLKSIIIFSVIFIFNLCSEYIFIFEKGLFSIINNFLFLLLLYFCVLGSNFLFFKNAYLQFFRKINFSQL